MALVKSPRQSAVRNQTSDVHLPFQISIIVGTGAAVASIAQSSIADAV